MEAKSLKRISRELRMLKDDPTPGIDVWLEDEANIRELHVNMVGPESSPYEGGTFSLLVNFSSNYPFEPPKVRFETPMYHPNIDDSGRICMDTLKMPPAGSWKPIISLSSLLTTIRLLLSNPNPDDPLMADIAEEFRTEYAKFEATARKWTLEHASEATILRATKPSKRAAGAITKGDDVSDDSADWSSQGEARRKKRRRRRR